MARRLYDFLLDEPPVQIPRDFAKRARPFALARAIEEVPWRFRFNLPDGLEFAVALAKVRAAVSAERWKRVLSNLAPTAGMSVLGGDWWSPRVLPNGGLAIRNDHRALAIDLWTRTRSVFSGLRPEEIAFELDTVLSRGRAEEDAILLHHGPAGLVSTCRLPQSFRPNGQTVLFVFKRELLNGLRVLGRPCLMRKRSCGAVIAIRVYKDTLCAYPMYRHDDAVDVLLAHYALEHINDRDQPYDIAEQILDSRTLSDTITPYVRDQVEFLLDWPDIPEALREELVDIMTADAPYSWKSWIVRQLKLFPQIFAKDYQTVTPVLDSPEAVAALHHMQRRGQTWAYMFSTRLQAHWKVVEAMLRSQGLKWERVESDAGADGIGIRMCNALYGRVLARDLSNRIGRIKLIVPHLSLEQRYSRGKRRPGGNARWFGWFDTVDTGEEVIRS